MTPRNAFTANDFLHETEWRYTYMSGRVAHYTIDQVHPGTDKMAPLYRLRNVENDAHAWATEGTLRGITSTAGWQLERHVAEVAAAA